jgi:hypothetical protein
MKRGALISILLMLLAAVAYGMEPVGKIEVAIDSGQAQAYALVVAGLRFNLGKKVVLEPYYQEQVFIDLENYQIIEKDIISNEYEFGALIRVKAFYAGWVHNCFHPINSEQISFSNTVVKVGWEW